MPYTLAVLGCGTMGIAVLSGTLSNVAEVQARLSQSNGSSNGLNGSSQANDNIDTSSPSSSQILIPDLEALPDAYIATVAREESARKLSKTFRSMVGGSAVQVLAGKNVEAAEKADVVLLWSVRLLTRASKYIDSQIANACSFRLCSCKPQLANGILTEDGMQEALEGKLLISILAGTTIAQLKTWSPPSTRVVRAMPNTPCKVCRKLPRILSHLLHCDTDSRFIDLQIREGMTIITPPSPSSPSANLDRNILTQLFSPIGRHRFLDEKHFDACTALSGSGPAFACLVLEAMADGGVMMGLPRNEALELAAQSKLMDTSQGLGSTAKLTMLWLFSDPVIANISLPLAQSHARRSSDGPPVRLPPSNHKRQCYHAWRLYDRRSPDARRWQSQEYDGEVYTGCYAAR